MTCSEQAQIGKTHSVLECKKASGKDQQGSTAAVQGAEGCEEGEVVVGCMS